MSRDLYKEKKMENNEKMAITPKGLKYLLIGLLVMVSGYILMVMFVEKYHSTLSDLWKSVATEEDVIRWVCPLEVREQRRMQEQEKVLARQ